MYFLSQVKAWKKLHTSGFETDFEYIRTLSYNQTVTDYDVTVLGTKNVVISSGASGQGGKIWATFDNNTIIARSGNYMIGDKSDRTTRNQILNVPELIRGAVYQVTDNLGNNNYVSYTIDNEGRVSRIECPVLRLLPPPRANHPRDGTLQGLANSGPARDGRGASLDNGGHMIGARFSGPVELINYHAQELFSNQNGAWKQMENQWANQISANGAGTVTNIVIIINPSDFPAGSKRPDRFNVSYDYGGVSQTDPANTIPHIFVKPN